MKLIWSEQAWDDYLHWQATDPRVLEKINALLKDCKRSPFRGLGKPEPLRGTLSGWWSRRINGEHRFVYKVVENGPEDAGKSLWIAQCRFHYTR